MQDSKANTRSARIVLLAALFAVVGGLSACGGSGNGGVSQPEPAKVGAARFGANFAVSFSAAPNSDPRDPAAGDIIPLSLTTDPFEVP